MSPAKTQHRFLIYALAACAIGLAFRCLYWTLTGHLNADDFENIQIIWLFEHGVLPFRDYYHTHLPLYHVFLYSLFEARARKNAKRYAGERGSACEWCAPEGRLDYVGFSCAAD